VKLVQLQKALSSVTMTPLGWPLVPEVYNNVEAVSAERRCSVISVVEADIMASRSVNKMHRASQGGGAKSAS
jgi:hypothetical protein